MKWVWEHTNPAVSGTSGDISKLFKHETTKNPGVFKLEAPKSDATLMAREVIQNSWDAALDLRLQKRDTGEDLPSFELTFEFKNLVGGSKAGLVHALDLKGLAARASGVDRGRLGLREDDCLNHLDEDEPLKVLMIHERGTTGMYGPWEGAKSHMYLALVSLGYTEKLDGSGGSYGFGKAGLIRGSATRTVVAYTCFEEDQERDPGITRRLLGMTYWGQHEFGEAGDARSFTGFGRFGSIVEIAPQQVEPLTNDDADAVAGLLGIEPRSSSVAGELGTTFLLVQPTVAPKDLIKAVERNWWPALEDGVMEVMVDTEDGHRLYPRPRQDPVLGSFIHAYEIARMPQDNTKSTEKRIQFPPVTVDGESTGALGLLGMHVDLEGWSFPDRAFAWDEGVGADDVDHRSLIALVRQTRMVIEYLDVGHTPAFVRGAFVADDGVNDLLRKTEPKSHDEWQTRVGDENVDLRAVGVADKIIGKIKRDASTFRRSHKAVVSANDDISLPEFDRFMNRVLRGTSTGGRRPPTDTRPVSIRLDHGPVAVGTDRVKVQGTARFALTEHCEVDVADVEISVIYRFVEDGRVGDHAVIHAVPPPGFNSVESRRATFRGTLSREDTIELAFESEPYSGDWSGRLTVSGDLAKAEVGVSGDVE